MDRHRQAVLSAGRVGPVAHQPFERITHPCLRRTGARHRQDRIRGSEQPDVPEHVLAVLAAHHDQVFAVGVGDDFCREVAEARVVITPLGREEVHDRDTLGPSLEQRRRRRDEMDVAIDRRPTVGVDRVERDDQRRTATIDLDRAAHGPVREAVDDLHLDRAGG